MDANGNGAMVPETEKLVYPESVFKLSEMASVKIALVLWYNIVTPAEFTQNVVTPALKTDITNSFVTDIKAISCKSLNEALKNMQLPKYANDSIKSSLYRIHVQMTRYISTLHHEIFGGNLRNYGIKNFNPRWWHWYGNGEIDGRKTALNILSVPEFNEVQKFAIKCAYRVVNDVSMVRVPTNLENLVDLNLREDMRIKCFILYLENEAYRVPAGDQSNSVDSILATLCLKDNHSWFEYFWDRLGFEVQTMVAESMLITNASSQFQKRLLSMMNWFQKSILLQRIPYNLVLNFWIDNEPEKAFEIWILVKDEFTDDQFSRLVILIFGTRLYSENDIKLLVEVWNTADDHLKNNFGEENEVDIPSMFFDLNAASMFSIENEPPAPSCLYFIYLFLLTRGPDYRKKTMLKIEDKLALCYGNSLLMGNILRLCWPDDNELYKFKKSAFGSSLALYHGGNLINELQFAKLSVMMMIHSPDENATRDFVKKLLFSSDLIVDKAKFMFCRSKWADLCGFIDRIWSEDVHSSLRIKKKFVSTFAIQCTYRQWNTDQNWDEFVEIVAPMLKPECSLLLFQFFSDRWCSSGADGLEEMYFFSYLSWCLDDDTNADDLRMFFNRCDRCCKWIYLVIVLVLIFV